MSIAVDISIFLTKPTYFKCWAVEGYQLWLVGDSIPSPSNSSSDTTENEPDDETDSPKTKPKLPEEKPKRRFARFRKKPTSSVSSSSSENISLDHGQLLQLQFVKSALAMNPCMVIYEYNKYNTI